MSFRAASAMIVSVAVTIVAGCSVTSQGEPIAATAVDDTSSGSVPSSTSSGGQDLPFAGAPKVDDPLDTTRFQQDPCQSLTSAQAQELSFPAAGEPREMPLGNACEWSNPNTRGRATIHFLDQNPNGLSAEYQADKEGKYAYFEVLSSIEGFPAVATDIIDDRDIGRCTVVVGVSDETAFEVPITLSEVNVGDVEPCTVAARIAGMALQTMKNG